MIETRALRKVFGPIVAVDGVSLRVERGEVLGFLGPNGAGKSTTMKMVTGFLRATSGGASVCGHDVARDPLAAKRCIGYLPEGAPAYPDMTAEGFLGFVASVRGLGGAAARKRISEVASLVHLEGVMRQPIETLSKGYKRRVGLAQAILHDPPVLILDEPTDGLDPNQKFEVRELIRRMAGEKCVVLSTHILEEVEAVCTRAVVIAQGRVVADGTPGALRAKDPKFGAVTLGVRGNAEGLETALRGLEGVASVETVPAQGAGGGGVRVVVRPAAGRSIGAEVGRVVRERGVAVDEFVVEQGRLDEVFRMMTGGGG